MVMGVRRVASGIFRIFREVVGSNSDRIRGAAGCNSGRPIRAEADVSDCDVASESCGGESPLDEGEIPSRRRLRATELRRQRVLLLH